MAQEPRGREQRSIACWRHSTVSMSIIFSVCSPQSNQTLLNGPFV